MPQIRNIYEGPTKEPCRHWRMVQSLTDVIQPGQVQCPARGHRQPGYIAMEQ